MKIGDVIVLAPPWGDGEGVLVKRISNALDIIIASGEVLRVIGPVKVREVSDEGLEELVNAGIPPDVFKKVQGHLADAKASLEALAELADEAKKKSSLSSAQSSAGKAAMALVNVKAKEVTKADKRKMLAGVRAMNAAKKAGKVEPWANSIRACVAAIEKVAGIKKIGWTPAARAAALAARAGKGGGGPGKLNKAAENKKPTATS